MAFGKIKKAAKSAAQQISSRLASSHGTKQSTPTSQRTAPIYNRQPVPGSASSSPLRYGFPTPTITRSIQTGGGLGTPPNNSATTAGYPGVSHQATSGHSNFQHHYENIAEPHYQNVAANTSRSILESYYQNVAGSVPPLPLRPVANAIGSNYGQGVASSLAQNQGNGSRVMPSNAQPNNSIAQPAYPGGSHAAPTTGVRELIRSFGQIQQNSTVPVSSALVQPLPLASNVNAAGSNYNEEVASLMAQHHGHRSQAVASNARSNTAMVQPGYPAGSHAASTTNVRELARNFGESQQNSNELASNTFVRKPADFPAQASSVQTRIAELRQRGVNLFPGHANAVQPNIQSTVQDPFAASSRRTAQNNATNAGVSTFPQLQDPRDFVLQAPPMREVSGYSAIPQATQRFGNSQPIQPYSNIQPVELHVNTRQHQPYSSNHGSQQGQYYDPQQGQNYGTRPFSSPGEHASYQAEVERLMSHPGRIEHIFPHGTPMGLFTTPAGWRVDVGRMQPGTTEFSQFPVGVTSLGTVPYEWQNAQTVPPNQAQPASPVIIRL